MTNYTFAQLCGEFMAVSNEVTRLQTLPPQYRPDEYPYILDQQLEQQAALKAEMRRRLESK